MAFLKEGGHSSFVTKIIAHIEVTVSAQVLNEFSIHIDLTRDERQDYVAGVLHGVICLCYEANVLIVRVESIIPFVEKHDAKGHIYQIPHGYRHIRVLTRDLILDGLGLIFLAA